jgi:hypothetical protein
VPKAVCSASSECDARSSPFMGVKRTSLLRAPKPRAFERLVNGRQPLLRIGWAIVRPKVP